MTGDWILITFRLPGGSSRARVAVWREIRRSGALHVQRSVAAFPATDGFRAVAQRFRAEVERNGGTALTIAGQPLGSADAQRLTDAWNGARDEEYSELAGKCAAFLKEIDHEFAIAKFTLAELEEEEAELDKLERWHERIAVRDLYQAPNAEAALDALDAAHTALERYSDAVYEHTQPA